MTLLSRRQGFPIAPKSILLASLSAAFLFFSPTCLSQTPPVAATSPFSQSSQSSQAASSQELFEGSVTNLAMGTLVQVRLFAPDEKTAQKALETFEAKVDEYARLFTVHAEGPLNDVNRLAGSWVAVDCRVAGLVESAKELAQASDRAFEPTIGTLVNVWKIGFGGTDHPDEAAIQAALKKVDYRRISLDMAPKACRVKIDEGQSLDLGAIAKGWIGTQLTKDIAALGVKHAIVDLGGNVALLGNSATGRKWRVGVQRPDADRGTTMAVIEGENESVITSGAYERNIESKGKRYGHILSAVTGEPVATDIGSVTIVDADGARADGWCTALFALGTQKGVEMLKRHKELKAFIVDDQLKRAWVSRTLADRVTLLDESIKITVVD